ncbi:MAG: transposase [Pseudomonadota bacterium]
MSPELSNEVFLSAMSIAELMIKHSIGKVDITFDPVEMTQKMGIELLSFSGTEAMILRELPLHHKDPFDRMLIAQSMINRLILMSDEPKFLQNDCKIMQRIIPPYFAVFHSAPQACHGKACTIYHPCGILPGTDEPYHCRPILSKPFPALDWLAQLTTHIPDKREHTVRYYGYYSNKSRGLPP